MRTTVDLPQDLLEKARQAWGFRTKQETLRAGLEELLRRAHREQLRTMAGKIDLDLDVAASRGRKRAS